LLIADFKSDSNRDNDMRRVTTTILVIAAAVLALRADAPNVYAIRGARIVTAAGAPIESATVVIRNGYIDAVGATVMAPPEAQLIDGKGLVVYPGLIDLGNTKAAEQPAPQPPQNMRTTAEAERWKRSQILKAQTRASDAVKVDDPEMMKLAQAGITSVLALPSGEIFHGQSAFVNVVAPPDDPQIGNIVEQRRGLLVLKSPVALHVSFPANPRASGNAYPQSLMGVMAFVRQSFIDAQHYRDIEQKARNGRGTNPRADAPDDPALEAMQPALDRRMPVAFEANEAREILRALKIAREFNLDPIVTGGRYADDVAGDLKAQNARVIYSLNYPTRRKSLAPDADEPIRVLRERANAPKIPGELAKAGVRFAFESAGLAEPRDFLKNAAKAVKAGLPSDAAVRALTVEAAAIAGVADRIGSIERGKIANLVVTDGDLFEEKSKITHVFVDGRPVSLEPATPAPAGRGRGGR
jgi:imidazolonepropionase-like amidohydrolase